MATSRVVHPTEASDIMDAVAKTLVLRNVSLYSGGKNLHLASAYRPKNIVTGYESDLVLNFEDSDRNEIRVELDLRIHNPR
jgi:hypothetical protein